MIGPARSRAGRLGVCLLAAVALTACATSPAKQMDRRLLGTADCQPGSGADVAPPEPAFRTDPKEVDHPGAVDDMEPRLTRDRKALLLNAGAATALMAWGVYKWDYGQVAPNATAEQWFGQETREGGADKLGHFWTAYALSHLFASIYEAWDYTEEEATTFGTLSSAGFQSLMEFGDLFSRFGFSPEDMIMNLAGAGAGYLLRAHPRLGDKIDFRMEYAPSLNGGNDTDIFTDYEHHKYLVALKGSGFASMEGSYLEYLEIQAGYFARGYEGFAEDGPETRQRTFYVGLGLNVGRVISHVWNTSLFDYFQVPGTYVPIEADLDR